MIVRPATPDTCPASPTGQYVGDLSPRQVAYLDAAVAAACPTSPTGKHVVDLPPEYVAELDAAVAAGGGTVRLPAGGYGCKHCFPGQVFEAKQ